VSERKHATMVEIGKPGSHGVGSTMTLVEHTRRLFSELVAPGNGTLAGDLDLGAFLIANAIDPDVDIDVGRRQLDELADAASAETAAELAIALFGGAGHDPQRHFTGNRDSYYQAENSLFNRVLERRVGIPITLAVLLVEVGRRLDISLHGVGMPGHFLVGSTDGFIDPFNGGVLLDAAGCQRLFEQLAGPGSVLPQGALGRTPPAFILKRMLFNLSAIAANQQQRRTSRAVRSLLAAFPDASHQDHVQHAYAAAEIGQFAEAAQAGELALGAIPAQVRDKLQAQIEHWRARLN
jgi:regulator of sirC expression with transglutaminase-like and TPR domain